MIINLFYNYLFKLNKLETNLLNILWKENKLEHFTITIITIKLNKLEAELNNCNLKRKINLYYNYN